VQTKKERDGGESSPYHSITKTPIVRLEHVADCKDAKRQERVSKPCLRVNPAQTSRAGIRLDEEL
jgi:hypothetical protein